MPRMARRKSETKTLDVAPGVAELDAYNREMDKLKAEYAPLLHKIFVNAEYRRV